MKRGEIWLTNLDPTIGAEIRKTRPCIIVNNDSVGVLPLKVVVPLTDWQERYRTVPWMVLLAPSLSNGLTKLTAGDTFQVRSLSNQRFLHKIGELSEAEMERVVYALALVFRIRL